MRKTVVTAGVLTVALSMSSPLTVAADENPQITSNEQNTSNDEILNITSRPSDESISIALNSISEEDGAISVMSEDGASARLTTVQSFSGADRFEVANSIARSAFPNGARQAILAGSEGWADALGSTSLAGQLNCPILLTDSYGLTASTLDCLKALGVTSVIIVGGPRTVSPQVEQQLKNAGISVSKRMTGADRYEVQMNIFNEIKGSLTSKYILVASGERFPDALSASPLLYAEKAPIFLTNSAGQLNSTQRNAIKSIGKGKQLIIVGGTDSISTDTQSFLESVSNTTRLGGADRYEASASFADWAVKSGLLTMEGASFATGEKPYDALTGSSLQGKTRSAMLLVNSTSSPAIGKFVSNGGKSLKFFGGPASVPTSLRTHIINQVSLVNAYDARISLNEFATVQANKNANSNYNEILNALNPESYAYGSSSFYQFADISRGYSGKITAQQIDAFIQKTCDRYGCTNSTLIGMGSTMIQAARTYNVNEVYLLAHAILESGWGTSTLSQGKVKGYEGYYNFFGIGAYDKDPLNGGGYLAKSKGWDTPQKGMLGAAEWISKNYVHGSYGQNTLYKMRWCTAASWHQYATSLTWATGIARVMGNIYTGVGLNPSNAGLTYLYPVYR